jgi:hypothetical protein
MCNCVSRYAISSSWTSSQPLLRAVEWGMWHSTETTRKLKFTSSTNLEKFLSQDLALFLGIRWFHSRSRILSCVLFHTLSTRVAHGPNMERRLFSLALLRTAPIYGWKRSVFPLHCIPLLCSFKLGDRRISRDTP